MGFSRVALRLVAAVTGISFVAAANPNDDTGLVRDLKADIERPIMVSILDQHACISDQAGPFLIPHSAHPGVVFYDARAMPLPIPGGVDLPWQFSTAGFSEFLGFAVARDLIALQLLTTNSGTTFDCQGGRPYVASQRLLQAAIAKACQTLAGQSVCYHGYNLGSFRIENLRLINSYNGVDRSSGASTTFRSYRVDFRFVGKAPFVFQVPFNIYYCNFMFRLNQANLRWMNDGKWKCTGNPNEL